MQNSTMEVVMQKLIEWEPLAYDNVPVLYIMWYEARFSVIAPTRTVHVWVAAAKLLRKVRDEVTYDEIYECLKESIQRPFDASVLDALLLRAGIEPNPGPIDREGKWVPPRNARFNDGPIVAGVIGGAVIFVGLLFLSYTIMTRALIQLLLLEGGVEPNPGPPKTYKRGSETWKAASAAQVEEARKCRKCGGPFPGCQCPRKSNTRVQESAQAIGVSLDAKDREIQALKDTVHDLQVDREEIRRLAAEQARADLYAQILDLADYRFTWYNGADPTADQLKDWAFCNGNVNFWDRFRTGFDKVGYVADNVTSFIQDGVGVTKFQVRFLEVEANDDALAGADYRCEPQKSKDLKSSPLVTEVELIAIHPIGTLRHTCKISLELFSQLLSLATWDLTAKADVIERRLLSVAKGQHQIGHNKYSFTDGAIQQNTVRVALGWILCKQQEAALLGFQLLPGRNEPASRMAIARQRSSCPTWDPLKRAVISVGSLLPTKTGVLPYLRPLVALGMVYASPRVIQMTLDLSSKGLSKESQSILQTLISQSLKSSVSSSLDGFFRT